MDRLKRVSGGGGPLEQVGRVLRVCDQYAYLVKIHIPCP